jgi:uncharacterized protein YfaS (alpha-2-macroglobulin family)
MGFEPDQQLSWLESVNEFKDRMRSALEEAKADLVKLKDDMAKYYNQKRSAAPTYKPGDKVYLDTSDVQTTRSSKKLSHKHLGPFSIERQVGNGAYRLQVRALHCTEWFHSRNGYTVSNDTLHGAP